MGNFEMIQTKFGQILEFLNWAEKSDKRPKPKLVWQLKIDRNNENLDEIKDSAVYAMIKPAGQSEKS